MNRALAFTLSLVLAVFLAGCTTQTPTHVHMDDGDFYFKHADYTQAAENFGEVASRYPGNWYAQYRLGQSLMELGQLAGARRALEIAHDRRRFDQDVSDALAEVMFRQGAEAQLYAFLRERADATQSVHSHLRLAHYAIQLNDPDSARLAIQTAIEFDEGTDVEPYLAGADLAERVGDLEMAVRRLRQAYGINPRDERVLTRLRDLGEIPGPLTRLRDLGEIPGPTIALPPGR